ncbi:MAG: cell division protein CrgA [Acidimicrobiales bacterium]
MPSGKPSAGGRVTPSQKQRQQQGSGRYTAPVPKEVRQSPPWFPYVLIGLLVLGLLLIVGNYAGVLPGGTHNWYLLSGIGAIVVGLIMATTYH